MNPAKSVSPYRLFTARAAQNEQLTSKEHQYTSSARCIEKPNIRKLAVKVCLLM